jgi:3-dehydroquinate synthase
MVAQGADRETVVLALGGGVIGDLAGFVAATYMRGVDWLQIPTTLLAQVDSSVGGKVGINLAEGKNLIGAFWQPRGVLIDPEVLATLSEREYRAGLAEVIKYGAIADAKFLEYLEDHVLGIAARDAAVLTTVIARCCQLKAEVVADDERELSGRRAILNFGHTYGHALERVVGYGKILHGEAVAVGMLCAARLAHRAGRLTAEDVQRLAQLLGTLGLPTSFPAVSPQDVMAAMHSDKKKRDSQVQLILPNRWGEVQMVPWPGDDWVLESMRG